MELTCECPECRSVGRVKNADTASEFVCQSCRYVRQAKAGSVVAEGVCHCPYCGTEKLYIQKDFPQGLGVTIVIAPVRSL